MAFVFQEQLEVNKEKETATARNMNKNFRNKGYRIVYIRFIGGSELPIVVTYYAKNCDDRKRKSRSKGCYPGLILMGVHDHCTPELASEVSLAAAALCSLKEAQEMLANRGIKLDIKTIRNIMKRFSARARLCQKAGNHACTMPSNGKGRRIVISTDGGRTRVRKTKRGPKTSKQRNRYHTDWREPKLLIIYVADDNGRCNKEFSVIIDGIIAGADRIFELILSYLKQLNITSDDSLLFIADGALWIWDRISSLKESLQLKNEQLFELLDFYHAVEHLNAIANLKTYWTEKKRKKWISTQRSTLKAGYSDNVIKAIKNVCENSKNKELQTQCDYFAKNASRMHYAKMAELKFLMGSGAIESTVRRVINLRLKGPGIFWHEDTANEMIMLRSYYKAKRWECIREMSYKGGFLEAA